MTNMTGIDIKAIRLNRGDTQKDFADWVGMDVATLSHIENGRRINAATAIKLSRRLDIPLDDLYPETEAVAS